MNKYKFLTKIISNLLDVLMFLRMFLFHEPKVKSSVVKFKFNKEKNDLKEHNFSNIIFKNIRKKLIIICYKKKD